MLLLLAALVRLGGGAVAQSGTAAAATAPPLVKTDCGLVEGTLLAAPGGPVAQFLGIPYARAPIGTRRWQPPQRLTLGTTCWNGTLQASGPGPACMQRRTASAPSVLSEDCLRLHVWAGAAAVGTTTTTEHAEHARNKAESSSMLKPVMVYLHGGSLVEGSAVAIQSALGGEATLAPDVVSIGLNYRLGVLGFLALRSLVATDGRTTSNTTSGNYGLLDCIAALQWIQRNIQAFGGDPTRVTIYGQSSGGSLVFALLSSPAAAGLFHRAISMSGSPRLNSTWAEAADGWHLELLRATPCHVDFSHRAACLRNMSAVDLVASVPEDWDPKNLWSLEMFARDNRYALAWYFVHDF